MANTNTYILIVLDIDVPRRLIIRRALLCNEDKKKDAQVNK